jgi:hypothetical protein
MTEYKSTSFAELCGTIVHELFQYFSIQPLSKIEDFQIEE